MHLGSTPFRAPQPKLSGEQAKKEQHHIRKEVALGHLRRPTKGQLSEWAARTDLGWKKGRRLEPLGLRLQDAQLCHQKAANRHRALQRASEAPCATKALEVLVRRMIGLHPDECAGEGSTVADDHHVDGTVAVLCASVWGYPWAQLLPGGDDGHLWRHDGRPNERPERAVGVLH